MNYSNSDIQNYIANAQASNPMGWQADVANAAQQYGVSGNQIDAAMAGTAGWGTNAAQDYLASHPSTRVTGGGGYVDTGTYTPTATSTGRGYISPEQQWLIDRGYATNNNGSFTLGSPLKYALSDIYSAGIQGGRAGVGTNYGISADQQRILGDIVGNAASAGITPEQYKAIFGDEYGANLSNFATRGLNTGSYTSATPGGAGFTAPTSVRWNPQTGVYETGLGALGSLYDSQYSGQDMQTNIDVADAIQRGDITLADLQNGTAAAKQLYGKYYTQNTGQGYNYGTADGGGGAVSKTGQVTTYAPGANGYGGGTNNTYSNPTTSVTNSYTGTTNTPTSNPNANAPRRTWNQDFNRGSRYFSQNTGGYTNQVNTGDSGLQQLF